MSITRGNSQEDEVEKLRKLIAENSLTAAQSEKMYAMLNAYQNLLRSVSGTAQNLVSEMYNDPRVRQALSTQTSISITIQQPQFNTSQAMLGAGSVVASFGLELMKDMVATKNPTRKDMAEIDVLTNTFNNTTAVLKSPNKDNIVALSRNIQPLTKMMTKSEKRKKLVGGIILGIGICVAVALVATAVAAVVVATSGAGAVAALPLCITLAKLALPAVYAGIDIMIGKDMLKDANNEQRSRVNNVNQQISNAYESVKDDINKLPAAAVQQAKQLTAVENKANKENKATAATTDKEASATDTTEERRSYRSR